MNSPPQYQHAQMWAEARDRATWENEAWQRGVEHERAQLQPAIDRIARFAEAAQAKAVEHAVAAERERIVTVVHKRCGASIASLVERVIAEDASDAR